MSVNMDSNITNQRKRGRPSKPSETDTKAKELNYIPVQGYIGNV